MSYHIVKWRSGELGLFRKSGEDYQVLARWWRGAWRMCDRKKYGREISLEVIRPVSEEEAVMILFQCGELV